MTVYLSLNAADYLDNSLRPLTDPDCEFGELLNNLWAEADPTLDKRIVITIPSGDYFTSTPISWLSKIVLCYADGVTINWSGGNKTVLSIGADPNNTLNQNPGSNYYGDRGNAISRCYVGGITFNNISVGSRNAHCVGLRMQNAGNSVFENLTFNDFGTGFLLWVDTDYAKYQTYYDYFNALRTCEFNSCDVCVFTDGDPWYHGMITNDDTTVEFVYNSVATINNGTLTRVSGQALPTSGLVLVTWNQGIRHDCAIDGSYQLTEGMGNELPTGATSVNISWIYGTRTGCDAKVDAITGHTKGIAGGTGTTLPNSSTPVTLTWTEGARVWCAVDSNGLLSGGGGNPLPLHATVSVSYSSTTINNVTLDDGVLGNAFDPANATHVNISWTGSFTRTDVYLVPQIIPSYSSAATDITCLIITGGIGDVTNTGNNYWRDRTCDVTWSGGSRTGCQITNYPYSNSRIVITGGSGDAIPAGNITGNLWQDRIVTASINNGIVTLPANHFLINSMAIESAFNITKTNVTVTWNDGQSRTRTGCLLSRVRLEAEISEGTGDVLPTTGTVTLTQTRGLANCTLVDGDYGKNVIRSTYGIQADCLRLFHTKASGNIDTFFDSTISPSNNIIGLEYYPSNSGSYLLKGYGNASVSIDSMGTQPISISWTAKNNVISSPLPLDNVTIDDQSGGV